MVEDTESSLDSVLIQGLARPAYIRKQGENMRVDEESLPAGIVLNPASLALAGTMGHGELPVQIKPRIAIIGTGDELVPPGAEIGPGQLYESNTIALTGLVRKLGCEPISYPLVTDDIDRLRESLNLAAAECDAIITSGGVSMGDWDLVRKLMQEEGQILFWRLQIKPGGPPLFGTWNGTPLFGLPGNPVSSQVVFIILVAPWIGKSCDYDATNGPRLYDSVRVRMRDPVKGTATKITMRRISITVDADELVGTTPVHQGSGNLRSMIICNGLTFLEPGQSADCGDMINALWLR
jgi:molybdopterin molybdotransferase